MKKVTVLLLTVAAVLMLLLTGCKKEEPISWIQHTESEALPCVELSGGEYATYEDFRYILRKANKRGVPEEWGYREKRITDPEARLIYKDYGDEVFLTRYQNTTLEDYNRLLDDMKRAKFTVHSQSVLDGSIATTTLTYQGNAYTATYYAADGTIDITASEIHALSPYLREENESTRAAAVEGAKTSLVMRPLSGNSTGYVIHLENGHFIVIDGGSVWDLGKLLTYLEENAPEGQIPVVEAWFVTASGYDLNGWASGFYSSQKELQNLPQLIEPVLARDRVRVNGIYYNTPVSDAFEQTVFRQEEQDGTIYYRRSTSSNDYHTRLTLAAEVLTTQDGTQTPIYYPLPGQIYYFSGGLTVDVLYTEERNGLEDYGLDYKSTTSCYRITADGKSVLHLGCANETVQKNLLELYPDGNWKQPDVLIAPWKGRYLSRTCQEAFRTPVTLIAEKNAQALTGESAEVAAFYAQSGKNYYFSDGVVVYDFATGTVNIP